MILRNGKIAEPKKAKKKHGLAYWIIGMFTLAIECMLGINAAFLVYQSIIIVAHNMLAGTFMEAAAPVISLIISLAVGFCLMLGGVWVFGGFMDSLEDVKAYQETYHTGKWPQWMVRLLMVAIIGLDFTTLLFRASYFAEKGAMALFAFFVILILIPPILGPLIYVLEHTPRDRRLAKAREYGESLEADDIDDLVRSMDPDLRSRWLDDDASALEEHYRRIDARRAEQLQIAEAEEQDSARGQAKKNRPLARASLSQQAQLGSPDQK